MWSKKTLGLGALAGFALVAWTSAFVDTTILDPNEKVEIHMDGINLDEVETISSSEYKDSSLEVSPRLSQVVVGQDLTASAGSQLVLFKTRSDMRYYRVYVRNDSYVDYKLTGSTGTFTVPKNDYIVVYTPSAVSVGEKKLTVSSNDGSKLKGSIAVKIAETLGEVKN